MRTRVLGDPLVHFLAFGAVLFGVYHWTGGGDAQAAGRAGEIVVDQGDLDRLTGLWRLQWRREPAPGDVAAIVERHLREEVFYREALVLGLDHNDEIIRKRLAQKMEAVASDLGTLMDPPGEEHLREYLRERADFFRAPGAYAFDQVLFLEEEDDVEAALEALRASLQEGGSIPAPRRTRLAVKNEWPVTSVEALASSFGGDFAESLAGLPVGVWSGPVRSGYGLHLVRIREALEPQLPPFEEVRELVAREFEYQAVLEAQERLFETLLEKYDVTITAEGVPPQVRARLADR